MALKKIELNKIPKHRIKRLPLYETLNKLCNNFKGVYLAGGVIRPIINKNDIIKDYDIFFENEEIGETVLNNLKNAGAKITFVCPKGELTTLKFNNSKIQLITKFYYKSVEELVFSFDINAGCACITNGHIYYKKEFLNDVIKKLVTLNKVTFPVATMQRMFKYKQKGYYLPESTMINFVQEVSNKSRWTAEELALYID